MWVFYTLVKAIVVVGGFNKVFDIVAAEGRSQLAKYAVSGSFNEYFDSKIVIFFTHWRTPSDAVADVSRSVTVCKCFDLGLLT